MSPDEAELEDVFELGTLEDLEVAADRGVEHSGAAPFQRRTRAHERLIHSAEMRIADAIAGSEVIGVDVIHIAARRDDHITRPLALGNGVLVIEAEQDDRIASEVAGELQVEEAHGATPVRDAAEIVGELRPWPVVTRKPDEQRVLVSWTEEGVEI